MANEKFFKSREEIISMFIGLLIVIGVAALVVRLMSFKKGTVDVPGTNDSITALTTPGDKSVITENKNESVYVVQKGDYLTKIAKEKLGKADRYLEIAKLNSIKNPSLIRVGQELKLPSSDQTITQTLTEHKVVKGDCLWKIAVQTYGDGFQWPKIWQENRSKLRNPNLLEIGMTLTLPKI